MKTGKLEKWILTHAYLKDVDTLPPGWKRPRFYDGSEETTTERELSKAEILLNYFDLGLSRRNPWTKSPFERGYMLADVQREKFVDSPGYRSALASYSRTKKTLEGKGLVEIHGEWAITKTRFDLENAIARKDGSGRVPLHVETVTLTDEGRAYCTDILHVNSCVDGQLLTRTGA